jgi:hypothetical protein
MNDTSESFPDDDVDMLSIVVDIAMQQQIPKRLVCSALLEVWNRFRGTQTRVFGSISFDFN